MNLQKVLILFLCAGLLIQSTLAFETDQYNLPPQPLADIGAEVSEYTESVVRQSVDKVNAEIELRQKCLDNPAKDCDKPDKNLKRLKYLRSDEAVAREVCKILGSGIPPFTSSGSWLESHKFRADFVRYRISFGKSIFLTLPISYIGLASTVNMYDAQFGTDKIAHLFQDGYEYFKKYQEAVNKGSTPAQATEKAVNWGKKTERTIFGTWISGVYSNADLFSNYIGLKFYLGLTQELKIGNTNRPSTLRLKDGVWIINENFDMPNMLLKPFISNHLNEALNPSVFTQMFGLRAYVRHVLKKQACSEWLHQYPNISPAEFDKETTKLKLWNGEDYGFTDSKNFVTISNTCFSKEYLSKTAETSEN